MVELINGRTPEEIKNWMRCCSVMTSCYNCPYNRNDYCVSEAVLPNALAYIQHLEAAQPKWIGVKERLPEDECLAIGWKHEMLIGNVYRSGAGYACESDGEYLMDVTHWMPLPEPLEEEE